MVDRYKHLYKEVRVKSWEKLKLYSEDHGLGNPGPEEWNRWIFKGHESTEWELSTTLERTLCKRFGKGLSDAWRWERCLSREFMRKARGFLPDPPSDTDYMEWLALMQHYGAPTRLHDWTYSFWSAAASQGYPQREAAEFAQSVRSIAGRFPDDPFGLRVLMEAEWLAGDECRGAGGGGPAAADRAEQRAGDGDEGAGPGRRLARRQLDRPGGVERGAAGVPSAPTASPKATRWCWRPFTSSYVAQGVTPPSGAQNALYTAMELAPSNSELRYKLARDFEQRNMIREAIAIIRPDAFSTPHRGNNRTASAGAASSARIASGGRAGSGTELRARCSPGSRPSCASSRRPRPPPPPRRGSRRRATRRGVRPWRRGSQPSFSSSRALRSRP